MGTSRSAAKDRGGLTAVLQLAADLGVPDPSLADRVMLAQAVHLLDWHAADLEQSMRRADTVRRLIENVEARHGRH